jgi:sterol desaturase/sphingolipid hydroxylase (fatty acid hydroxylase superfamily)
MPNLVELWGAVTMTGVTFGLLGFVFGPLESAFRARHGARWHSEMMTNLLYFVLQNVLLSFVLVAFGNVVSDAGWSLGPHTLHVATARLPLMAQMLIALLAGDVLLYWGHRACHAVPLLWRFHAVHHSSTTLDWVAGFREHPLDGLFSQLCLMLPAAVLGIPIAVVAPLSAFRGLCASFVHANVRVPLGPLGLLVGDPVLHRYHHCKNPPRVANFANLAPYLDVVFGTHHRPADENYDLGVDQDIGPSLPHQLVLPFCRAPRPSSHPRSLSP